MNDPVMDEENVILTFNGTKNRYDKAVYTLQLKDYRTKKTIRKSNVECLSIPTDRCVLSKSLAQPNFDTMEVFHGEQ